MGLRNALSAAAAAAVGTLDDIAVEAEYQTHVSATYDASAGVHVATYSTIGQVKVVIEDFEIAQVDGRNVRAEDKKVLMPAANASGVVPGVNDRVVIASATWQVQAVRSDPAEALWEIQVRRA